MWWVTKTPHIIILCGDHMIHHAWRDESHEHSVTCAPCKGSHDTSHRGSHDSPRKGSHATPCKDHMIHHARDHMIHHARDHMIHHARDHMIHHARDHMIHHTRDHMIHHARDHMIHHARDHMIHHARDHMIHMQGLCATPCGNPCSDHMSILQGLHQYHIGQWECYDQTWWYEYLTRRICLIEGTNEDRPPGISQRPSITQN